MSHITEQRADVDATAVRRLLANQALSRAAGAPLVDGNHVELLTDARENYPAWLEAIDSATERIYFEMYIVHEDDVGREFLKHLVAKARAGVQVRFLYDWVGAFGKTSGKFWEALRIAGAEVRCCNPPGLHSPLRWLSRDHRKLIVVDGQVAFVSGLCIGRDWVGWPKRGMEPWRDTGVRLRGPAVADVELAFAEVWGSTGHPIPQEEMTSRDSISPEGNIPVRVIATTPETAGMYRLDLLVASLARQRLWLTDAYFIGTTAYVDALRVAAREGVDVRLLVPGASDIQIVAALSRIRYRPLLEAGVRIFEWDGPMVHAKTAVADSRWARVGSTNLNLASWCGNWELDLAVEDNGIAEKLGEMYLSDLERATEIVITKQQQVRPVHLLEPGSRRKRLGAGSAGRTAATAIGFGSAMGAALTDHRTLDPTEAGSLMIFGVIFLVLALLSVIWPRLITLPLAGLLGLMAISLLTRAYKLRSAMKRGSPGRSRSPE